jgi:hypothetical protein
LITCKDFAGVATTKKQLAKRGREMKERNKEYYINAAASGWLIVNYLVKNKRVVIAGGGALDEDLIDRDAVLIGLNNNWIRQGIEPRVIFSGCKDPIEFFPSSTEFFLGNAASSSFDQDAKLAEEKGIEVVAWWSMRYEAPHPKGPEFERFSTLGKITGTTPFSGVFAAWSMFFTSARIIALTGFDFYQDDPSTKKEIVTFRGNGRIGEEADLVGTGETTRQKGPHNIDSQIQFLRWLFAVDARFCADLTLNSILGS